MQVENGDRLCLCRADLTEGAREGTLDFNSLPILEIDTDFYDGVAFAGRESGAATEGQIAVAGLVVPYQLKDEEILFDPAKNKTGILNRVGDIVYTVWDGKKTAEFRKPVTLTRTFADGSVYDSILEFYHVFLEYCRYKNFDGCITQLQMQPFDEL